MYYGSGDDWMFKAACGDLDPNFFFPDNDEEIEAAKEFCRTCVVQFDCLEYALQHQEKYGVWGGHTAEERRRVNKNRRQQTRREQDRDRVRNAMIRS